MNQLYRRKQMKTLPEPETYTVELRSPLHHEEQEKQELIQTAPQDLTEEQIQKILNYCKTDPMFFFRYVGIYDIEKTSLFNTLLERLVSQLSAQRMCDQMFTLHGRKPKTKTRFSMGDIT